MASFRFLSLAFVLFMFVSTGNAFEDHGVECLHDKEEYHPQFLQVDDLPSAADSRSLGVAPPIRLYPYFGTLTGGTTSFRSYVQYDLVPPAFSYFQAALKMKYNMKSRLKVNDSQVCGFPTPSLLKTGLDTDFFFFFEAVAENTNYLATSTWCYQSLDTGRPIVAKIKLNLNYLKPSNGDPLIHENNINLLMHELVHSFGFSQKLFDYYLDDNGKKRAGHVKRVILQGSTRTVLDVPSLTARVRNHFGCPSLPGLYLENNGDPTMTAGSHLERKFFLLDIMTSGALDGQRISEFTLGVLEATGWYYIDYNYAEPNHFGSGQGCGFVNNKCSGSSSPFNEFCSQNLERGCFVGGRAGGKCVQDPLSDGCKYYTPSTNYDCNNPNAGQFTRLPELQKFGRTAGSKCFEGTLSTLKNDMLHSFCLTYNCIGTGSNTKLQIQAGKQTVVCTKESQISIDGYQGTISCPDPLTFCKTVGKTYCPKNCMGRGRCSYGKCICNKGFTGIDCSERI